MFRLRFFVILVFLFTLSPQGYALESAKPQTIRTKKNTDAGIILTSSSPFAKLHDVPIRAVRLGDGIWKTKLTTHMEKGIPTFPSTERGAFALKNALDYYRLKSSIDT